MEEDQGSRAESDDESTTDAGQDRHREDRRQGDEGSGSAAWWDFVDVCDSLFTCDVGPHSLRSLSRIYENRMRAEWDHTAALITIIHNTRQGIKASQMITPDKVNPYRIKKRKLGNKLKIADMARGFGAK